VPVQLGPLRGPALMARRERIRKSASSRSRIRAFSGHSTAAEHNFLTDQAMAVCTGCRIGGADVIGKYVVLMFFITLCAV
jgi:hypothetical protein